MESIFASCPFDDCLECSFRCILKENTPCACAGGVDILSQAIEACDYCAKKSFVATQDDDFLILSPDNQGVEEHKQDEDFDLADQVYADMMEYLHQDECTRHSHVSLPCQSRKRIRCEEQEVTFHYFKPFDMHKRIRSEEQEDFHNFLKAIF